MQEYGKIIEYNGSDGIILTKNEQVEFAQEDLLCAVKVGDYVVFRREKRGNLLLARFINIIDVL